MTKDKIIALEEQLTHALRTVEELSSLVADQAKRLEKAERQLAALMARALAEEEAGDGGVIIGDQRPPHW